MKCSISDTHHIFSQFEFWLNQDLHDDRSFDVFNSIFQVVREIDVPSLRLTTEDGVEILNSLFLSTEWWTIEDGNLFWSQKGGASDYPGLEVSSPSEISRLIETRIKEIGEIWDIIPMVPDHP